MSASIQRSFVVAVAEAAIAHGAEAAQLTPLLGEPEAERLPIEQLYAAWRPAYAGRPFVQILASGETPDTAHTVGTNRIDLSAVYDPRTNNFVLTSAEDNLVKGASGQMIQAANLLLGLPETTGLPLLGIQP